jgi:Protein of unknown function (DUF2281)
MSLAERIVAEVDSLSDAEQAEVLDFVEFLAQKKRSAVGGAELRQWNEASIESALDGMEDEPELYSLADVKEPFH